jgi:hypothetical protein
MIAFDGEYVTTTSDAIYSDYQTTAMMKRITVPVRNTLVNATGTKLTDIIACGTLVVGSTGDIITSIVNIV